MPRLYIFLLGLPLFAAETQIAGRVVDENNAGVPEARVVLQSGAILIRASTGPTGAFRLKVPSAEYSVTAERDGFFPLRPRKVALEEGLQEVHLILNHEREVFQSVQVESSTTPVDLDQTSSTKKLSGLNILNVPYPSTRNLRNAMKLIPGVVQDARGGLHFSGSAENEVLYTLDGFNISDPINGGFATRLDVDMVRSLEYSSGRYSPEFGKGSAGVLEIRTDMGDDTLRYSATNFIPGVDTRSNIHIGTWSPRFGLSGPIVKGRAWFSESVDAEYTNAVVPDLPKDQQWASSLRTGNLLRTQVNLGRRHILFGSFLVNQYNAPRIGLSALDPPSTTINQRTRTWFFSVKDQIYLARGMLLDVGFAEDRTFGRLIPQGSDYYEITPFGHSGNFFVDSTRTSRRDQLLTNLYLPAFKLAGTHQIKAGTDFDRLHFEQQARRTGYENFGLDGRLLHLTTFGGSGFFSRPSLEMSSYLLDAWRVRSNLTADIGVRQDWDELIRRTVVSPRFSFAWAPFRRVNGKLSGGYAVTCDETSLLLFTQPLDQYAINTDFDAAGRVIRGPLATAFVINDPHLKAPKYRNWTLQWDQQLPRRMQLSMSWLRKRGDQGLAYAGLSPQSYPLPPGFDTVFGLTNLRRDTYDSAQVTLQQSFGSQYEWMASYTRSRALSNSVLDLSVDQTASIGNNVGPLQWDAPNRAMGFFYVPTPFRKWALAGMVEARDGFPFSLQTENGAIVGAVNSSRFPAYFNINLHLEFRFRVGHYRLALRGGFNNLTNHRNYTSVNNIVNAPGFLTYYGSDGRHFVMRIRWLGKE